jgi:hypothetical protein
VSDDDDGRDNASPSPLTRYLAGRPARRLEFRSVSDGGPDDFGFTPPDGLRVVDKTARVRFSSEA